VKTTSPEINSDTLLNFWFANEADWFRKNTEFDENILNNFSDLLQKGANGELEHWENEANDCLALIILFDQFPRNMFRDTPKMYSYDDKALNLTKHAIDKGFDMKLSTMSHRQFMYMPLMHSESLSEQELCVKLFKTLGSDYAVKYAKDHMEIIKRFGRFPHRNEILNRESSTDEIEFMKTHSGY
jgi:uncharacterized protein (DUF924 family)